MTGGRRPLRCKTGQGSVSLYRNAEGQRDGSAAETSAVPPGEPHLVPSSYNRLRVTPLPAHLTASSGRCQPCIHVAYTSHIYINKNKA